MRREIQDQMAGPLRKAWKRNKSNRHIGKLIENRQRSGLSCNSGIL